MLRPYWPLAIMVALAMVLASLSTLLAPWPLTILVDNVLGNEPLTPVLAVPLGQLAEDRNSLLVFAVVAGVVVTFVSGMVDVLRSYVKTKLEQRIVLDFRSQLFQHTQRLSVPFADQISTGRLMYAINFEAAAAGGVIMAIEPLVHGVLTIVGMAWIIFGIDPLLAALALSVVPFLYYSVGYYAKHIQSRLLHVKGMEADALSLIHDALSMLRVVVAFVREPHELARYRRQGDRAVAGRVEVTVRQTLFSLAVNTITAIGTAMVLAVGASHALAGDISTGQLLVVLSYVTAIYKPLQAISHTIGSLQDQIVGLRMGFHVLDTEPAVQDAPDARVLGRAKGRITFENVSFSYPGRADTLRNISFDAPAGKVIAVVGPTGAGKTTLVSLIPRFYEPTAGRILIDGVDLREVTCESLRDQISLVPQEPVLFSGTIADNIRYGRLDATMDEIIEAAKAANSHDFIMRLPNQYDTEVGERGVQLSGGERQRICVARAFLKNAPILILDEPTSSIDSKTEAVILDALDRLMVGRTTFVIAHRLTTVRDADLILVLDHGELVEQGSAEELLQRDGMYRQLLMAQLGQRRRRADRSAPDIPDWLGAETLRAVRDADPPTYAVDWLDHAIPQAMETGAEYLVCVTPRNTGRQGWTSSATPGAGQTGPIYLSYHWLDSDDLRPVVWEGLRSPLPTDLAPGEMATVRDLRITAPAAPGSYLLQVTLVHESVAWLEQQGVTPLIVPVQVRHPVRLLSAPSRGVLLPNRSNGAIS